MPKVTDLGTSDARFLTDWQKDATMAAMAPRTSLWRMSDEATGGRLADRIAELREDGLSWRQMAQRLYAEHGLVVTDETLRKWGQKLGLDSSEAKAAS